MSTITELYSVLQNLTDEYDVALHDEINIKYEVLTAQTRLEADKAAIAIDYRNTHAPKNEQMVKDHVTVYTDEDEKTLLNKQRQHDRYKAVLLVLELRMKHIRSIMEATARSAAFVRPDPEHDC